MFEHVFFGAFTLVKKKAMTSQSWADMLENVQRPNQAQDQSWNDIWLKHSKELQLTRWNFLDLQLEIK